MIPLPITLGLDQFGAHLSQVRLSPLDVGAGHIELRLGLIHVGRIERVVDLNEHGPFLDGSPKIDRLATVRGVDAKRLNLPGDLGSDVNHLFRLERAGGADFDAQVAAGDTGGAAVNGRRRGGLVPVPPSAYRGQTQKNQQAQDDCFHGRLPRIVPGATIAQFSRAPLGNSLAS
ncbi:MAG TPA: hypothetical protein VFB96_24885 [Pirellulaceae bacterium]|nr:hypothetical protein [Pirellulaceae bacterium]